jgi:hypothetical protein
MAESDKRPVTLEGLLVSSLRADRRTGKALDREGADYARTVYAEDLGGAGDVSEAIESHATMKGRLTSLRHEPPRLLEFVIFRSQAFNLVLHLHVVSRGEPSRQGIHLFSD